MSGNTATIEGSDQLWSDLSPWSWYKCLSRSELQRSKVTFAPPELHVLAVETLARLHVP